MIANQRPSWWEDYLSLLHDPAHILFEITISILFDVVIIYLGYQIFIKRIVIPRLRHDIHAEIDREHDLTHEEDQ